MRKQEQDTEWNNYRIIWDKSLGTFLKQNCWIKYLQSDFKSPLRGWGRGHVTFWSGFSFLGHFCPRQGARRASQHKITHYSAVLEFKNKSLSFSWSLRWSHSFILEGYVYILWRGAFFLFYSCGKCVSYQDFEIKFLIYAFIHQCLKQASGVSHVMCAKVMWKLREEVKKKEELEAGV